MPVTWTAPTAIDNCGGAQVTSSHISGTFFAEGTTTITFTAVDNCGLTATATVQVIIQCESCTNAPIISCPSNYTACIGNSTTPSFAGIANVSPGSNCSGTPTITFTDNQISAGPCAGAQVIERTWVGYDTNSGLTSTCIQTISVLDNTNPIINNLPSNIILTGNGLGCQVAATWVLSLIHI